MQHLSPVFVAHYSLRERFLEQLDLLFPVAAAPTTLAAAHFFTTEIWTPEGLVTFYVFFAIQLKTRRVHISIPRSVPKFGPFEIDHKSAA